VNRVDRIPPGLFGGSARSRLLGALFISGPTNRRRLARSLALDPTFALQRLRSLVDAGLVERLDGEHAYGIAWSNPIAAHVAAVIAAYTGVRLPVVAATVNGALPLGHLGTFERPGRSRVLLALAGHEPATGGELADVTGLTLSSVHAAAETLEDAAIIRGHRAARPMTYVLNAAQPAYREVRVLLLAMRAIGSYR
jgi:DNA-binding MarR family transcriptional regulator